ncbi:hypothetical protein J2Z31_002803 [Sinorhizobium kostiense]|uniref:NYN domain-containing protein n=1 Tax=Sinorhizobium kostiense TaxID=76747 RepID=A0ABS4R066_9HYPH|nr:hypothetical protein [Sinorhizobium kostiense]
MFDAREKIGLFIDGANSMRPQRLGFDIDYWLVTAFQKRAYGG